MLDGPLVRRANRGPGLPGARPVRLVRRRPAAAALRLDACARYLHDLSNDDTRDAALPDDGSWVVRRTVVEVAKPLRYQERMETATWCGGTGSRWAERRVSLVGHRGGRVEAAVAVGLRRPVVVHAEADHPGVPRPLRRGRRRSPGRLEARAGRPRRRGRRARAPLAAAAHRPRPARPRQQRRLLVRGRGAAWGSGPSSSPAPTAPSSSSPSSSGIDDEVTLRWVDDPGGVRAWLQVAGTTHASLALHRTPDPNPRRHRSRTGTVPAAGCSGCPEPAAASVPYGTVPAAGSVVLGAGVR